MPGVWVTLHRVGRDTAGPVDSVRTDRAGRYRFRWSPTGDTAALYFVSSSYAGIAYFTPPLREARTEGEAAEIVVFDTTSRPIPLAVQGHHVVLAAPENGRRRVLEVWELSNDTSLTRVAGDEPTWRAPLPAGAADFAVGQGDVSPAAVTSQDGEVRVFAPFAPGLKQLSYEYTLPLSAFPLRVPVLERTGVLEVLVEEPQANVSGAGLQEVASADAEGRRFRRWLAQDVAPNAVITLAPPAPATRPERLYLPGLLVALGAAMLFALVRAFRRAAAQRERAAALAAPHAETPERLAERIVDLDAAWGRMRAPTPEAEAEYRRRREELKGRLADALARRDAGVR